MVAIDMSAAQAPPRKRANSQQRRPSQSVQTQSVLSTSEKRTHGLMGIGQLGQLLCVSLGQYADAATIGKHWPPIAPELAGLAEEYDWLAKPIDFLIQTGPFTAFVVAALPFGLQIAANHKWIDGSRLASHGVVPPEVLESQMKAEVARMQTEAIRQQREAMQAAAEAQAEMEQMLAAEMATAGV